MKITQIIHLADIHFRLYKRHREYELVLDRTFERIEELKDDNTVIFLGGDIVHNKTDMSPELIYQTSKFLKRCADSCPTILILGNHDATTNQNRLDALSPIVTALNHPNLHFWKETGVYRLGDVAFSVFGVYDPPEMWVLANSIDADYKIALHHGAISGAQTDIGHEIETGVEVKHFDGFQLGLLGDIHSFQYLNRSKTIAYPSSLIQQNHSETIDRHGFIVWNLRDRTSKFVEIPNDYGFVTFDLIDGECVIPDNLPPNLRVRIKHENTTPEQIEQFVRLVGKQYTIVELVKQRNVNGQVHQRRTSENLGNSRNVDFQNKMIAEYLVDSTAEDIAEVCKLNIETNKLLPTNVSQRNVVWKPIKLEFSNMFSYGENNSIDFTNFNGSLGLFSKNAEGKSSLFNIICFVLYDKTTIASKASHILNNTKDSFYCKIQFDVNGQDYFIERIGTKKKDGSVKVDVNFWTFDDAGNIVNLNGEDRDKTNYAIRNYIGTYDDFILTALSTQYDNQNFIDKTQRDRKDLLYKFLDITIYDDLYKLAKEESRECQTIIRQFEKEDLHSATSKLHSEICAKQIELDGIELQINTIKSNIKTKSDDLIELNKQWQPTTVTLNLTEIQNQISENTKNLLICKDELDKNKNSIVEIETKLSKLSPQPDNYDEINLKYNQLETKISIETTNHCNLKRQLQHCEKQNELLSNHKYDPNCPYCIDNELVKSAQLSIAQIPDLKLQCLESESTLEALKFEKTILAKTLDEAKQNKAVNNSIKTLKSELVVLTEQQKTIQYKGKAINDRLKDAKKQEQEYLTNASVLEQNANLTTQIEALKRELGGLERQEKSLSEKHRAMQIGLGGLNAKYAEYNTKLDTYLTYVKKYRVYDLYLQALSREGVPYRILESVLPVIEYEVNQILNSLVNFTVRLEANDDKYIHANIVYNGSNSWPVELSSGMERFILSLAFRTSLSEITTLPKANFLAIDEGFGVLDSENLLSIGNLFTYLKKQYDFLICISHIDSMRDLVDTQIGIEKINGYSFVKI